jgi:hypothetical protein
MICDENVYEFNNIHRIVIIGDIHGDIKRFKKILIDANIINNDLEWIAQPPNTFVVQMGDQIDSLNRNNASNWEVMDDISVLHLSNSIDNIAKSKGGRLISLIGNHELMNSMGNFSYVSETSKNNTRNFCFMPGGSLSSILGSRNIVLKIGPLFFCHAGITKDHLDILDKYNKPICYLNTIWKNYILNNFVKPEDQEIFDKIITSDNGILWTRNLTDEKDTQYILNKLGCNNIFVGHTTVDKISLCNKSIWFTDTGISRAYGRNTYHYIDIDKMEVNVKTIVE